jgi:hypothetical protein
LKPIDRCLGFGDIIYDVVVGDEVDKCMDDFMYVCTADIRDCFNE